jgi:zinc protease
LPPSPGHRIPVLEFDRYRLDNGLTVILHENHDSPVVAVMVMYHVGSKNEVPGRTGFAHLFEHMMFKGSAHVPDGDHFRLLQEIGANVNGTTSEDRTNYFEVVPSNELELALYLESDRMGFLLPALHQGTLDNQRDVVKNERRQSYDNQPYGTAYEKLSAAMYPPDHPYHWPVIGSMEDLSAASLEDVHRFFKRYYAPNNAVLVIAGDFAPGFARSCVEKYFGPIPGGPQFDPPRTVPLTLSRPVRLAHEEDVQLPRYFRAWHGSRRGSPGDALADVLTDILSAGRTSRLHRRLLLEQQTAQSVHAMADGGELSGTILIDVMAKPGTPLSGVADTVDQTLQGIAAGGVTDEEVGISINKKEAQLVRRLSTMLGIANALAMYHTIDGDAGLINGEFERFTGITAGQVTEFARGLTTQPFVELSIVPRGFRSLAASAGEAADGRS